MLRVIRSTLQGLDITEDREGEFADAAEAGGLVRETYAKNEHGQKGIRVEVRAYSDPDGQHRFAVLYSNPAGVDWQQDTEDYDEARALYEETVRNEAQGAAPESDEDGRETPLFDHTDVPGIDGYEDGAEGAGDAEAYMLVAEWTTEEAEKAQQVATAKAQDRQIAYARAIDAYGRGGQILLAGRVRKSTPTVQDIADRGRKLIRAQFTVDLYEDNAGGLYLRRRGETTVWSMGYDAGQLGGPFASDAAAWRDGEWEPSESDGQIPGYGRDTSSLTHIATWSTSAGLDLMGDAAAGRPAAGAGGREYLDIGHTAVWSVVRGESPDARAVEPGRVGLDIPSVVLDWAEKNGVGADDTTYLLVTPSDEAGEVMGELDYISYPMAGADMTTLRAALEELN
ncbi:hypothetical protein [Streptomyces sp. NBC_01237]|uniref:hypothetical protein n=1 Tax=Streptomyces sp. NBC_01237 TaxID=2903790 RepID=UPI002DD7E17B|nr:hypothetical protein [Streptomyces sp. NBC_01237]WRZ78754.1 hypothetical protein OG251_44825 [Streptomyces sp. NBC_01237]